MAATGVAAGWILAWGFGLSVMCAGRVARPRRKGVCVTSGRGRECATFETRGLGANEMIPADGGGVGSGMTVEESPERPQAPELERILRLIGEVARKSSIREDPCFYRGEPERYPVVSSGLYRACPHSGDEAFDIGHVEQEMVEAAKQYTTFTDDDEILAEIQHFGGRTNLIDFTEDCLVALFFAGGGGKENDGRVVLHWPEPGSLVRPKHTINRVVAQKSVFVRPRRGFILPDSCEETVVVPGDLKEGILSFLKRCHGISENTVYRDIHGFIRAQNPQRSRYVIEFRQSRATRQPEPIPNLPDFLGGLFLGVEQTRIRHAYHQQEMAYADAGGTTIEIRHRGRAGAPVVVTQFELKPEAVVDLYSSLIRENPSGVRLAESYCRRGEAHLFLGSTDLALEDFGEALDRNEKMAEAYHGRGNAYSQQGSTDRAMGDLQEALRIEPGLAAALIDLGNVYRDNGSPDEALPCFDISIALMSKPAFRGRTEIGDGYFFRALAWCALGHWPEAMDDLKAARRGECSWHRLVRTSAVTSLVFKAASVFESLPTLPPWCTFRDSRVDVIEEPGYI